MTTLERIEEIVVKYHNTTDNCTNRIRYDNEENEFWLDKELQEALGENAKIEVVFAYSSCSYDVDVLVVSYIENEKLLLYTKKLESY